MKYILDKVNIIEYLWYFTFIFSKTGISNQGENIFNIYNFYYKLFITIMLLYYFNYFSQTNIVIENDNVSTKMKQVIFTAGLIMLSEIIYKSFYKNIKKTIKTRNKINSDFLSKYNNIR